MIMKKLIAISVVFALVVGTAFAVDLSGTVTGSVNVLRGDSGEDSKVTSSAEMNRIRIDGSGQNEEGTFGAYIRTEVHGLSFTSTDPDWDPTAHYPVSSSKDLEGKFSVGTGGFYGNAWWKPIDQLKLWVGSNGGDGFFGKEGYACWMFYQTVGDTAVADPGNAWWSTYTGGFNFRNAFYGGGLDGQNAFYATISPAEIVDINLELPFFNGGEVGDVIGDLIAQVSLNFDFGNIALTYAGDHGDATNGKAYVYFNLGSIENLSLDVGVGLTLPGDDEGQPIAAGAALKYNINDAFGIKFRTVASFAGKDDYAGFGLLADVLPFYAVNDSVTAFLSGGVAMTAPEEGDAVIGFHLNPYVQVGSEWGPKFLAGFRLWTDGVKGADDKSTVNWAVPIAISVGF